MATTNEGRHDMSLERLLRSLLSHKGIVTALVLTPIVIYMFLLVRGCGVAFICADDPLSEEGVCAYVQDRIREETGDEVIAHIVESGQQEVSTFFLDGTSFASQDVIGGRWYKLEVVNASDDTLVASASYSDGYVLYGTGRSRRTPYYYSDYRENRWCHVVEGVTASSLARNFETYRFSMDGYMAYISVVSSDYERIYDTLRSVTALPEWNERFSGDWVKMYVYKDELAFRSAEEGEGIEDLIDRYHTSTKAGERVVMIGSADGPDGSARELFASAQETAPDDAFDYVVLFFEPYLTSAGTFTSIGSYTVFGVL